MPTAAARPHVISLETGRQRVRGCPVGPALLKALGEINQDVHEALAAERARLCDQGYPTDLPLPALWWPRPRLRGRREEQLFATIAG